jgi:hypothetical protein
VASASKKKPKPTTAKAKPKTKAKAKKKRRAIDLVTIGFTPPELAPGTAAHRLNKRLARKDTRPSVAELAKLPWLRQDEAYRAGYYVLTHGLRKHAKHPEIEMCNVPGVLLEQAIRVLNSVSDYVLGGAALKDGEVMILSEDPLAVVGFMQIKPGERGAQHDEPVLRLLFLR